MITVVNITAPDEMDPMKMGKWIDGAVNNEDITSMIYYFANKGYLKIDLTDEDDPKLISLLSRLEKKGFIAITPDPADRRCKRVSLEVKGRECMAKMDATIASNEAKLVANFTEEEKRQFADFLTRAITNLGGSPCRPLFKEESD